MRFHNQPAAETGRNRFARRVSTGLSVLGLLSAFATFAPLAHAQTTLPPAGTPIGNKATARYTDGSNIDRSTDSNTVITVVQQVAAVDLTSNRTATRTAGAPVYFSHAVKNNGNGNDTFNLTVVESGADNFNIAPVFFLDANADGVPDSNVPIPDSNGDGIPDTGSIAAGASFNFVVAGVVPNTAQNNQNAVITVTATSVFTGAITDSNTDTVNVTTNAAIAVLKSVDVSSGPAGSPTPRTYTLRYTNTGNLAATNLTITDAIPAGMTYVNGSGRWSVSGTTALGDGAGGDPAGINYAFNPAGNGTVTAIISTVGTNITGTISFQVTVNATAPPGTIINFAPFNYDDDNNAGTPDRTGQTNDVPFDVTQTTGVTFTGQTIASANQGQTLFFDNLLTNTGNGTDTFDITIDPATATAFPAGTSFQLLQTGGAAALLDSNGNSIPDTGPVVAGGTYTVRLRVDLPPAFSGAGPFTVNKVAKSGKAPTTTATAVDTLTTIVASTVELTNAAGAGAGALTPAPVTTLSGAPGATLRYELNVANQSAIVDSYALGYSTVNNFAPVTAAPAGFTVTFRDSVTNAVISNTGNIAAGGTVRVFADVFIPANAAPQNVDLFFRVVSGKTGATDVKFDRATVTQVRAIAVQPNNVGQIFLGSSTLYSHTVTNNGNGTETNIALGTSGDTNGFTSVVYLDTNGDGVLQPAEAAAPLTSIPTLAPGASIAIIVKVQAPLSGVSAGQQDQTTVTATLTAGPSATATDTTTIVAGDLKVDKLQAVDPDGAGPAALGAFTKTSATALPGGIIRYRITAENTGGAAVTNVVITDATPAYTVYDIGDGTSTATGVAVWTIDGVTFTAANPVPANGAAGTLTFTIPAINPGQIVTVTFGVKIQG